MITFDLIITPAAVSAFFAGIGLILTYWGVRENTRTRQIQLLESAFRSIKEVEMLLYTKYKKASAKTKREWDSLLFNSIEFFSFLVNKKYIKDEAARSFFDGAIIQWYEQIFLQHASKSDIKNQDVYPEMKALYKEIRSKDTYRHIRQHI
ncbi:MAG: hypothetical protein J4469_03295 [Candidatus Aenigmarchaeota archaeon]|nr:hypothetical protein [Candidatus Aenigmarchaeota archaeon]